MNINPSDFSLLIEECEAYWTLSGHPSRTQLPRLYPINQSITTVNINPHYLTLLIEECEAYWTLSGHPSRTQLPRLYTNNQLEKKSINQ